MDNREAKFVLNAYRPGGRDTDDPRFAEALEQARRDPTLGKWFRNSVAFDAAVTEKLNTVEVPPDLRENILVGVKVSRPLRWFQPFIKWAIAAALILSATLGSVLWEKMRPAHLAGWQNEALEVISSLVRNESSFDAQSRNTGDLIDWLRANHAPAADTLPDKVGKLTSIGCKTFSYNGAPLSVVCFTRPDGGLIHLVTTSATTNAASANVKFAQQGDWATATWREGNKVYMLALEGSPDQLRTYLL